MKEAIPVKLLAFTLAANLGVIAIASGAIAVPEDALVEIAEIRGGGRRATPPPTPDPPVVKPPQPSPSTLDAGPSFAIDTTNPHQPVPRATALKIQLVLQNYQLDFIACRESEGVSLSDQVQMTINDRYLVCAQPTNDLPGGRYDFHHPAL